MKRNRYSVFTFTWWVDAANEHYEEGRENKAFRILRKSLGHYDGKIPAYIYFKYFDMWKDFEELYETDYQLAKMQDDELATRIKDALQKNRREKKLSAEFQKDAKHILKYYLNDSISNKVLYNKLFVLEKRELDSLTYTDDFVEEMTSVFRAYFYGRHTISYEIAQIYRTFLCNLFKCETYENVLKKRLNQKIESDKKWPEPIKCAIKPNNNTGKWKYIYIDPTIQECTLSRNMDYREGKNMLAMFKSMILFECGAKGGYLHHNGCRVISNWYSLMEKYPRLAENFVRIGNRYAKARREYIRKSNLEQERGILNIPVSEREKIVQIWDEWDKKLIKVVD